VGTYRFAVLFDTHYCLDRDAPAAPGCAEVDDRPRYEWMRRNLFPRLLDELRRHRPDRVLCTGDLVEGGGAEPALLRRELEEVFARLSEADLPILNARGTHEPKSLYAEVARPLFSGVIGEEVSEDYCAFDAPAGRFVLLDYLSLEPGSAQARWLRERCESAPEGVPLFVFAHAPLVNFARPFFSHEPMQKVLNDVFSRRPPTALFCGHTHNQAFTHHHRECGSFVQIKGSTVGFPDLPVEPLERRHVLLLEKGDAFYWGVPEDHAPGYWILDVSGRDIVADWYGIGRGLLGRARLSAAGEPPVILRRPAFEDRRLRLADLPLVRHASLEASMSGDRGSGFEFVLNGEPLGRMPANASYAARRSVPLTKRALGSLCARNELRIERGPAGSWLLGGLRIAVSTHDGRTLFSPVSSELIACGDCARRAGGDARFRKVGPEGPVVIHLRIDADPVGP
jgi:hypothetical protein